jgi:hypothetical protein
VHRAGVGASASARGEAAGMPALRSMRARVGPADWGIDYSVSRRVRYIGANTDHGRVKGDSVGAVSLIVHRYSALPGDS